MTRIGRIFTDNNIRVHPCHPCNPCSIRNKKGTSMKPLDVLAMAQELNGMALLDDENEAVGERGGSYGRSS